MTYFVLAANTEVHVLSASFILYEVVLREAKELRIV